MTDAWDEFDRRVDELEEQFRAGFAAHVTESLMRSGGLFFMAADLHADRIAPLLLRGRRVEACEAAAKTERFAQEAIKRKHRPKGLRRNLSTDMARAMMWQRVYLARWLLRGTEDGDALESALAHAQAARDEVRAKPRSRQRKRIAAFIAAIASRMGDFALAIDALEMSDGRVYESLHDLGTDELRELSGTMVRFLGSTRQDEGKRADILRTHASLLDSVRAGDSLGCAGGSSDLGAAIYAAYLGMKYFEEIRRDREFTFESVVMSLRLGNRLLE